MAPFKILSGKFKGKPCILHAYADAVLRLQPVAFPLADCRSQRAAAISRL